MNRINNAIVSGAVALGSILSPGTALARGNVSRPDLASITASQAQQIVDNYDRATPASIANPQAQYAKDIAACQAKASSNPNIKKPAPMVLGNDPVSQAIAKAMNNSMAAGAASQDPGFQKCTGDATMRLQQGQALQGGASSDEVEELRVRLKTLTQCVQDPKTLAGGQGCVIQAIIPRKGVAYAPTAGTMEVNVNPDAAWIQRMGTEKAAANAGNQRFQDGLKGKAVIIR